MRLITSLGLEDRPFQFYHRNLSNEQRWETFHAHHGMEFLYVHEGHGRLMLGRKLYPIQPHTLMVFRPFELHRLSIEGPGDPDGGLAYIRTVLVFEPHALEPYLAPFPKLQAFFRLLWKSRLNMPFWHLPQYADELERRFTRLAAKPSTEVKTVSEYQVLFMLGLLQWLEDCGPFHEASDETADSEPSEPPALPNATLTKHAEAVMQWIEHHFHESISLDNLAQALHLSPYHVSHLFRECTGSTVMEYATARRLREACLLLETTDRTVSDIGEAVGLANISYFTQLFKRHMNCTPARYRKQFREMHRM